MGRRGRTVLALAVAGCGASAALADDGAALRGGVTLICAFSERCQEGACATVDVGVDVALPPTYPGPAALLPETGPIPGEARLQAGVLQIAASDGARAALLLRDADGAARYATGTDAAGGLAVLTGQCRVAR